jgi:hypothetical protein
MTIMGVLPINNKLVLLLKSNDSRREFKTNFRYLFKLPPLSYKLLSTDLPLQAQRFIYDNLNSNCLYLEYGLGGSTLIAHSTGAKCLVVDSDLRYVNAINDRPRLTKLHANIGKVGPYGAPIFSTFRKLNYKLGVLYSSKPYLYFETLNPDLVLIDGRYRLACALQLIKHNPKGNWVMMIDDYVERSEYHEIERFAYLMHVIENRVGVFRAFDHLLDAKELDNCLAKAVQDYS